MINPTLKPYPAYKPAAVPWLQQVPEHWEVSPGLSHLRFKQEKNTGMVVKQVLSLSYGRIVIKPKEKLTGLVPESFETYQIVGPGDIIVRATDLQNDRTSLRIGEVKDRGIITSAYLCLNVHSGMVPSFGYYLIHTYDLMKVLYGFGSGLRQNLDWKDFKRMPLAVPPPDEQHLIVRYLHALDAKVKRYIRTKRTLIARLQEQKQAIIQRAVTRGLNPNVKLKPSGVEWLGEVPDHWEELPLKRIARFENTGSWGHDAGEVEVPVATTAQIDRDGNFKVDAMPHRFFSSAEATRYTCTAGDILVVKSSGSMANVISGKCGIIRAGIEPFVFSNFLLRVRAVKTAIRPEYLFLLLRSHITRERIKRMVSGSTYPNLKVGEYTAAMFPIPKLEEQDVILHQLMAQVGGIDKAEALVAQDIATMQEYHTRLIADVVTGAVDVREAVKAMKEEAPVAMEEELAIETEVEEEHGTE